MYSIELLSPAICHLEEKIEIPWMEKTQTTFKIMIPFMLIGAMVEELFFRGFMFSLTMPLGIIWAIMISSFIHYFFHFLNPSFMVFDKVLDKMMASSGWFLTTIILGILFIYSESLIPVVIAHSFTSIGFSSIMNFKMSLPKSRHE